jgi:hypothetical protein
MKRKTQEVAVKRTESATQRAGYRVKEQASIADRVSSVGMLAVASEEAQELPSLEAEEVARLAYSYWEARGRQGGSPEEDWQRAEDELRRRY